MTRSRIHLYAAVTALVLTATMTACGSTASTSPTTTTTSVAGLTASDAWVKTAPSGMTAAFLTLTNRSGTAQVLVAASSPASAVVQIHETVSQDGRMVMRENKDGITVPAGGTAVLEPGGDHLMLMSVTTPIVAGDVVPFTLRFASGATLTFSATAKDFSGAQESYQPAPGMSASGAQSTGP